MDAKIVVRYSSKEKEDLNRIASDLGLNLSEYIRKKTLGKVLKDRYIKWIEERLKEIEENQVMTLKQLLGLHWEYLSKAEKKHLMSKVLKSIEDEELPLDVVPSGEFGRFKFIKVEESSLYTQADD